MSDQTILAIETSCDETGIAVISKSGSDIEVLAANLASQIDIHRETGGVVPEVAAREHTQVLRPLIQKTLKESKIEPEDIDGIAVTVGPGLIPALATGVNAARTLAYAWNKPLIPIHHIEGHVITGLLTQKDQNTFEKTDDLFPSLALIVSGGHTLLIQANDYLDYKVIGSTKDDAAGEVFDKVGRMLELPYPGGPEISKVAQEGDSKAFNFPRPMIDSDDYNFSFSGLKTAVLYALKEMSPEEIKKRQADIAASFEQAVIDSLVAKTIKAATDRQPKQIILAGGVAANKKLRQSLKEKSEELDIPLHTAPLNLCGDNGVMIGMVGLLAEGKGRNKTWHQVDATARLNIEDFSI